METTIIAPVERKATGADTEVFRSRLSGWLADRNGEWLDSWMSWADGSIHPAVRDILDTWQACGHLVKWASRTGRLHSSIDPKRFNRNERDGYAAAIYFRSPEDRKAVGLEMEAYVARIAAEKRASIYRAHPELCPEESADPEPAS